MNRILRHPIILTDENNSSSGGSGLVAGKVKIYHLTLAKPGHSTRLFDILSAVTMVTPVCSLLTGTEKEEMYNKTSLDDFYRTLEKGTNHHGPRDTRRDQP